MATDSTRFDSLEDVRRHVTSVWSQRRLADTAERRELMLIAVRLAGTAGVTLAELRDIFWPLTRNVCDQMAADLRAARRVVASVEVRESARTGPRRQVVLRSASTRVIAPEQRDRHERADSA